MKQTINKLVKQKTSVKKDIGKIYYIIEINEEELNKNKKKILQLGGLFVIEESEIKIMMIFL